METLTIPKIEYLLLKQQISDLQAKIKYLQDTDFMNKLNFFINLYYREYQAKDFKEHLERIPLVFGAGKNLIAISDDFNKPMEEFNEYL